MMVSYIPIWGWACTAICQLLHVVHALRSLLLINRVLLWVAAFAAPLYTAFFACPTTTMLFHLHVLSPQPCAFASFVVPCCVLFVF